MVHGLVRLYRGVFLILFSDASLNGDTHHFRACLLVHAPFPALVLPAFEYRLASTIPSILHSVLLLWSVPSPSTVDDRFRQGRCLMVDQ